MATLEQLNFEVLINDKDFDAKVVKMQQMATDLNTTLSNLLNFSGRISPVTDKDVQSAKNLNKILQDNYRLEQQKQRMQSKTRLSTAADDAAREARERRAVTEERQKEAREVLRTQMAQERLNQLQRQSHGLLSRSGRLWREIGTMAAMYFSVRGATRLISTLTRVTAEFEMQRVTLGAILNDSQAAGKLFDQLKELAVRSPFQFKDLTSYAKQLSAYSIPVNELYDTTKMLADVSAGLGVGMDRLVLAYGQIRSASFLRGQEVRQLTEAGIPILEELRKQFVELGEEGITVGDVFDKISKRMVPFEMVEKVFKNMTSEGGKFYEMQEVQADTLKGKISNLTDAYQIMFSEIGNKKQGLLKGAVDMARSLADNYQKVGRAITTMIATYGAYKVSMALIIPLQKAHMLATMTHTSQLQAFNAVMARTITQTRLYKSVEATLMTMVRNPWILIATAVAAVGTYLVSATVQAIKFRREMKGVADEQYRTAEQSVDGFKKLVEQLRNATEGSQNYRDAISKLNSQYGEYLPNLLNEKNALLEIARVEKEVTNAIYARARAYAEVEGLQKIEEHEGKRMSAMTTELMKSLSSSGIAEDMVTDIVQGFRDALKNNKGSAVAIFSETMERYLGKEDYDRWRRTVASYYQYISEAAKEYAGAVNDVVDAEDKFNRVLDARFGAQGYSSAAERNKIGQIEEEFSREEANIRNQRLSDEETNQKLLDNRKAKLEALKVAYTELNEEAAKMGKEGAWDNQLRSIQAQLDAMKNKDNSWLQTLVNPLAGDNNRDLKADISDSYSEYADKIRKEYKDVTEVFEDAQKTYNGLVADKKKGLEVDDAVLAKAKEQYESLKERKGTIEEIGKALHISIDDKLRKGSSGSSSGKSEAQKTLELRRDTVKDIFKWYEKLQEAGMAGEDIKTLLKTYFPDQSDIIDGESYRDVLIGIANALEKYDKAAAQSLRDDLGLNEIDIQFKKWKDAKKAAEEYEKFMESWLESSELFGEGSEFNVSKIIDKYKKQLQKIDKEREQALKLAASDASLNAGFDFDAALDEITEKTVTEKSNALKTANEEIRKQAENWVKNWEGIADIDISHMADLTTLELEKLMEALQQLSENPEQYLSQDLIDGLSKVEGGLDTLIKGIKDTVSSLYNEAEQKNWAKVVQQVKRYKDALGDATDVVREFAEIGGNTGIVEFADHLDRAADGAVKMISALAEGDELTAAMSVVTFIASEIIEMIRSAYEYKNAIKDIQIEMAALRQSSQLTAGVNSIFGSDTYRSLRNAYNLLGQLQGKMDSMLNTLGEITVRVDKSKWWMFTNIFTTTYGWFQHFFGSESYASLFDQLGVDLFDEAGRVNVEVLEAMQEKYDKLSASEKQALQQAINDAKDYNAALDQIDEVMSDLVGNIADDFAGAIIDQWKAAGDAAADYGDILDDLASQYAQMYIRNTIMENLFGDDFKRQLESLTLGRDATGVMSLFDQKVKELEDYYPFFEDVLNGLSGYFTEEGTSGGNTLGGGIKSITEDTANLLASYVNAIRADVAAIRAMMAGEANLSVPAPTLTEYLTQIQANTFNTAENTAALLTELRSMMTVTDGPALRVFM